MAKLKKKTVTSKNIVCAPRSPRYESHKNTKRKTS